MRVALIDWAPDGHHTPYARAIALGLQRAGHAPLVAGPRPWCDALGDLAEALPVDCAPPAAGYARRQADARDFLARAFNACADAGADLAHVLYLDGSITALLRAPVPAGLAVVATQHWYPFVGLFTRGARQAVKGVFTAAGLWGLGQRRMRLVVHSRRAQATLQGLGLRDVHAVEYPNAAAGAALDPSVRQRERLRLGLPPDARILLCFGGTRPDKGVDLAIAALAGTDARLHLLVAGLEQGFDRAALLALAQQHGVAERLLLRLGQVPEAEVAALYCAADALLLPYRPVFAGQSGPLMMAGAMGLPVIAADVPVLAETVAAHGLGHTFRAGQVQDLHRVLQGPWPQVNATAQQRFAAACDPAQFGASHVALYEGLQAPGRLRGPALKATR